MNGRITIRRIIFKFPKVSCFWLFVVIFLVGNKFTFSSYGCILILYLWLLARFIIGIFLSFLINAMPSLCFISINSFFIGLLKHLMLIDICTSSNVFRIIFKFIWFNWNSRFNISYFPWGLWYEIVIQLIPLMFSF